MARSATDIQTQIISYFSSNNNLTYQDPGNTTRNLTYNTNPKSFWSNLAMGIAMGIAYFEQLVDQYVANMETQIAQAPSAGNLWIQAQLFKFQYDANDPQVVQLVNAIPQYPVVDTSLQVITACGVTSDESNSVNIKVATGNPYTALSAAQLSAAQSYLSLIGAAGVDYTVISLNPDRLYINATVYYNGMFAAVMRANIITAVNNYLQTLSQTNFDGSLKMSDIEGVIRNVTGVNDVVMNNVKGRAATDPFGSGAYLVENNTLVNRLLSPQAGYIIAEDTTTPTDQTLNNPAVLVLVAQ